VIRCVCVCVCPRRQRGPEQASLDVCRRPFAPYLGARLRDGACAGIRAPGYAYLGVFPPGYGVCFFCRDTRFLNAGIRDFFAHPGVFRRDTRRDVGRGVPSKEAAAFHPRKHACASASSVDSEERVNGIRRVRKHTQCCIRVTHRHRHRHRHRHTQAHCLQRIVTDVQAVFLSFFSKHTDDD
jgi:hypothetical protein